MSVAAISISQREPFIVAAPPEEMQSLVRDVAKRCLIELAVSLAIGTATVFFTASSLHGTLIFAAITIQTVCNAALRCAAALAERAPISKETEWIRSASPYLCVTMFAYLTAFNGQILLHELGHAIAATLLFKNANPQITITPCLSGITRFATTHLTSFGGGIGKSNALLLTALMGPTCTLLVSGIAMAVGFAVQAKFQELGGYLIGVGRGDFFAHSFYALTALSKSPSSEACDFVRLRTYGIHPLASAIAILSVPIFIARACEKNANPK